jgi:hypothetical protein
VHPEPGPLEKVSEADPFLSLASLSNTLQRILQDSFDESGFGVAQGTSEEGTEYLALMNAPGKVMINRRGASSIKENEPSGVRWVIVVPYSA